MFPLYTIQISPFILKDESFAIMSDGLQLTKNRMILASETEITNRFFEFQYLFQSLNLSQQELCLFYPFILTSCNGKYPNI